MANLKGISSNRLVEEAAELGRTRDAQLELTSTEAPASPRLGLVALCVAFAFLVVAGAIRGGATVAVSLLLLFCVFGLLRSVLLTFRQARQHILVAQSAPASHRREILLAGAEGEQRTLEALLSLPDDYHLFNQVDIPNERSTTGVNEADLVVAGPNGLFVIEVKHNRGTISGGATDLEWSVRKDRVASVEAKAMRNPITQVNQLVRLLLTQIPKDRPRPWVQGIVVFSHEKASLEIETTAQVPCLRLHEVTKYIASFPARMGSGLHAVDVLTRLKSERPRSARAE